jgi:hypothetical protein
MIADHHHLLVVGKVDRQHRTVTADHPAQAFQASVAAQVASGQTVSMGHGHPPVAVGHQAHEPHQGDVLLSNHSGTY